jgi:diphthamide biosynthesis enzyme Dph1/Dph2-like protein
VKESGKKSYTLSIGKPNPAKLANFPEVKFTFVRGYHVSFYSCFL